MLCLPVSGERHRICLLLSAAVAAVEQDGRNATVITADGEALSAPYVILTAPLGLLKVRCLRLACWAHAAWSSPSHAMHELLALLLLLLWFLLPVASPCLRSIYHTAPSPHGLAHTCNIP